MKDGNGHQAQSRNGGVRHFLRFPWIFLALGVTFVAIVLGSQHWNHVVSWLPFAILLLCPMMHFFHGGHGQHKQSVEPVRTTNESIGVQSEK